MSTFTNLTRAWWLGLLVVLMVLYSVSCHIEIPDPVSADFNFNPASGITPAKITFTNTSTNATSYTWEFGDGTTSIERNPTHTYVSNGTYAVKLVSKGKSGSSGITKTISIVKPEEPVANFTIEGGNCLAPCSVKFVNASKNANSFQWAFGDNQFSQAENPSHTYQTAGNFEVTLVVTNTGTGKTSTAKNTVTILPQKAKEPDYQWDYTYGGKGNETIRSIVPTRDDGYFIVGISESGTSTLKSAPNYGDYDGWLIKVNANGTKTGDFTFGGSGFDGFTAAVEASDGGFLLCGYSNSTSQTGNKSAVGYGDADLWVVKIDANGKKMWDKAYGGAKYEYLASVVRTLDGGFLLGGTSYSGNSGNKASASFGDADYWVVKIDGGGNLQWERTYGGSAYDELTSVITMPDGGYVLCGFSQSGTNGVKTASYHGSSDYWLIKIDSNGNRIWDRSLGGTGEDVPYSAISTDDGGILVGGMSGSAANGQLKTGSNFGGTDMWVAKFDGNGNKAWDKSFGGSRDEDIRSIVKTTDGGFILIGFSNSAVTGNKDAINMGSADFWVVKIDSQGNKSWDKSFGGSRDDLNQAAIPTTDGGFILGGRTYSLSSGNKASNYVGAGEDSDCWIIKIK